MACVRNTVLLLAVLLVAACGSQQPQTLASLAEYKPEKEKQAAVQAQTTEPVPQKLLTHREVRQEYKELLELFEEKELREKIERRIADVHMMESVYDHNREAVPKGPTYYAEAKKAYLDILRKYPNSPENAEVLYQLAKAYDIEGDLDNALATLNELTTKHTQHPNINEAFFRKGDIHFSNQEYREAKQAYQAVIDSDNEKLELNAYYMLGWAHYKQLDYRQSVDAFTVVLNTLLGDNASIDALDKTQKPLAQDSISSISLAFDKIGGAETIAQIPQLRNRDYVWMVYDNLGEYYLSKELFEESASTFRLYVNEYERSPKAPDLHVKLVDTYITGGFSRQALKEKENYVDAYGIRSNYFANREAMTAAVSHSLQLYLDELASHFHSQAQLFEKQIDELNKKDTIKDRDQKVYVLRTDAIDSFDKAADFYGEFAQTFPAASNIDEVYFLKAETLFSSYQYPEAIEDYERVAYRPEGASAEDKRADAGYAAIISYEKQIEYLKSGVAYAGQSPQKTYTEDSRKVKGWRQDAVSSMLSFAEVFHTDKRSPPVLTNAAEYLFGLDQYENAIAVSQGLIEKNPQLDRELKKTAYGLIAHSYFKLENYQAAEDNYFNQRALVDAGTEEYAVLSERLAVSIFKKSEVLIANAAVESAIPELLKIKQLAPNSSVRVPAQYDAATMLLEAERWDEAIVELEELKTDYSQHELAVEFPRKLAFAYEKNQDWSQAAAGYVLLLEQDPDASVRQEALFLAATMFENNKDYAESNNYFKRYVENYPQPFDNFVEAHYHLVTNYEKLEQRKQRNQWLTALIQVDGKAGSQRTDRSRWLGAWANTLYGDDFAEQFAAVKLTQPLVEAIPPKNQALQTASDYYQAAAGYGILEFVTQSSYKTGLLYRQFADELRAAPAPAGLSADDQQEYATIIEEQAAPFDQLAADLQQSNVERAWAGQFDQWIGKSFAEMRILHPTRFDKAELIVSYGDGIY